MKFTTIKDCGKLGIEFSNIDTDGARVSRDFLKELTYNVVKRSTEYYDAMNVSGDHVFSYRESQFHSVVCPSIADLTASFVMEHPLSRRPHGEEKTSGHVDYWIKYRGYSFLMELKHSFYAYRRSKTPRQNIARRFDAALEQLKSVRREECRNLTVNKGLIKIALQAIVFYEGSKHRLSNESLRGRDFEELFRKLIENMKTNQRIDMKALWVLHERLAESYEYSKTFEIYPALGLIGNISEKFE